MSATTQSHAAGALHKSQESVAGKIGPNAILQVFDALDVAFGKSQTNSIADMAGLANYLRNPPAKMVDEREVVRLHTAVRDHLGKPQGNLILRQAGDGTAAYILANRIPRMAQIVLKALPAQLSAPLLLKAIAKHAWTFAGSGSFSHASARPAIVHIAQCPACTQVYAPNEPCHFYVSTLQGLFRALVRPSTQIVEHLTPNSDGRVRTFHLNW